MRSDKLLDGMVSVLRKLLKAGILIAAIQAIAIMPASSSPLLEQLQPVESWEPTPIKRGEFRQISMKSTAWRWKILMSSPMQYVAI